MKSDLMIVPSVIKMGTCNYYLNLIIIQIYISNEIHEFCNFYVILIRIKFTTLHIEDK